MLKGLEGNKKKNKEDNSEIESKGVIEQLNELTKGLLEKEEVRQKFEQDFQSYPALNQYMMSSEEQQMHATPVAGQNDLLFINMM